MSEQTIDMPGNDDETIDKPKVKLPGAEGVWVMLIADLVLFAAYFTVFSIDRMGNLPLFEAGRVELNPYLSFVNTLVLLTSSWFVFKAVESAKEGDATAFGKNVLPAICLGFTFIVLKAGTYAIDLTTIPDVGENVFFVYYFGITGLHLIHVIAGTGALLVCFSKFRKEMDPEVFPWIESAGLFWHLVDLLWVIIFPMMYLMGGIL